MLVTADTLFRDSLPGSTVGPFMSQFLLLDVPYGAQTVSQRIRTRVAGDDRVFTFPEWLLIQNGELPAQEDANETRWRHTATRLLNDKVLVVGPNQANVPGSSCELYTPAP
ncbi:hypothetical protein NR798_10715 [Archangium gephyra]|uniref:hypothetical protein n=1 Tax=Archangium gephyra TaxID=48 RepID=UPI0035D463CF